jgi:predicted small secreted protein
MNIAPNATESRRPTFLRWVVLSLLSAFVIGLSACNTIEGAGRDVEKAGEKIQDAADRD